jgi:protein-L-isoaspartate O-methyltransferase
MEAGGALTDPEWRDAFLAVPRELFVPYYYAPLPSGGHERLWRGDPDPARAERWAKGVYEDVPLATRMRDCELVSSSSKPSLMALMLQALCVSDGMRVLEIGTGTGYNAALLAHRLGDSHVTSVDLDSGITASARNHLVAAGRKPRVVTGDGALGAPAHAPFDRIIATCALPRVPLAWLEQCAPGALVLTPLATGLLRLRVTGVRRATGRFLATPAFFVPLRGAVTRPGPPPVAHGMPPGVRRDDSFDFLCGLTAGSLDARQAYGLWLGEGQPTRERYGVTVEGTQQWAWLDDPEGPHAWPLEPH